MKAKAIPLLLLGFLLSGCTERAKKIFTRETIPKAVEKIEEEQTVVISCNNENIDSYLEDGWRIENKETKKTTCTWKSIKSSPNCDLDLDKGCRITVPDTEGEQIEYLLKRVRK